MSEMVTVRTRKYLFILFTKKVIICSGGGTCPPPCPSSSYASGCMYNNTPYRMESPRQIHDILTCRDSLSHDTLSDKSVTSRSSGV